MVCQCDPSFASKREDYPAKHRRVKQVNNKGTARDNPLGAKEAQPGADNMPTPAQLVRMGMHDVGSTGLNPTDYVCLVHLQN